MLSRLSPENLAPNAAVDETEKSYQRLLAFLDLATGSTFAIARCNLPSLRKEILQRVAADAKAKGVAVKEVDISSKYSGDFVAAVRSGLDDTPSAARLALMVMGIDGLIYQSASQENLAGEGRTPFIARLNFDRERISQELPFPIVLWLESESLTLLLKQAPDFTQWISGHFHFGGPAAEAKALDQLLGTDESLHRQPATETRKQLQEFSGLLQELNETRGREDVVSLRKRLAVLNALAERYFLLSDIRSAQRYFTEALEISKKLNDRRQEGNASGCLGDTFLAQGDAHRAIEWYEQALAMHREIGDRRNEGIALGNLGLAYDDLGEPRRAIEYYEEALAIARDIGDHQGEAATLGNQGTAYVRLGELRRAIENYEQALAILREIGDRLNEGATLGSLGVAYADLGEPHRAIESYEQALAIAHEIGDRQGEGTTLGNLGNAYAGLGEPRRAIEFYERQLTIASEIGDRRGEGRALFNMALALAKLGDHSQAIAKAEAALKIFEEIEDPNAAKVCQQLAEWRKG